MHHRFALVVSFVLVTVASTTSPLLAQGWVDRTNGSGPQPRYGHSLCWDPVRNYTLLVGGTVSDTWSWDGNSWTQRGPAPSSPYNPTAAVTHGASGEVLYVVAQSPGATPSAYRWDGTSWLSLPPMPATSPVLGWSGFGKMVAAFDPVRAESIFFSLGMGSVVVWNGTSFSERPLTSNVNLTQPAIPGVSSVNDSTFMAWDPVSQRVVLTYRGWSSLWIMGTPVPFPLTRMYDYNGFGFVQRNPVQYPARPGAMATDTARNRLVMFDGEWDFGSHAALPNHTWIVANGAMTRLTTPFEPSFREQAAMAFDPVRGVCVLFGGSNNNWPFGDTWEFNLGPLASFTPFGTGCVGSRGIPTLAAQAGSVPRIGTTFTANIGNLPWTGPAAMLLGLSNTSYGSSPLPLDLTFLGAPTCSLYTSIDAVENLTNVLGAAAWSWTVPPVPGASFYAQVVPLDPGVNALGATLSNAAHGIIGL